MTTIFVLLEVNSCDYNCESERILCTSFDKSRLEAEKINLEFEYNQKRIIKNSFDETTRNIWSTCDRKRFDVDIEYARNFLESIVIKNKESLRMYGSIQEDQIDNCYAEILSLSSETEYKIEEAKHV